VHAAAHKSLLQREREEERNTDRKRETQRGREKHREEERNTERKRETQRGRETQTERKRDTDQKHQGAAQPANPTKHGPEWHSPLAHDCQLAHDWRRHN
jgi:hypothetical protein